MNTRRRNGRHFLVYFIGLVMTAFSISREIPMRQLELIESLWRRKFLRKIIRISRILLVLQFSLFHVLTQERDGNGRLIVHGNFSLNFIATLTRKPVRSIGYVSLSWTWSSLIVVTSTSVSIYQWIFIPWSSQRDKQTDTARQRDREKGTKNTIRF